MGARARGSRANGLGCESGEGFVERLACGLPEEELARDWPVSQSALERWAVVGEWWAGQRRASLCRSGWVQRSVGLSPVWPFGLGDEESSAVDAEMVQRRGLRDSQMVVRGWPGRPSWVRPATLLHVASGRPAGAGFWRRCDWACWA